MLDPWPLLFAGVPFVFAIVGVMAYRGAGERGLWIAWLAATVVLESLAVLYWRKLEYREVPLIALLLLGALPTLAGMHAIRLASRRAMPAFAQALIAGTVCWAAILPTLLLGVYVLGAILRL